MFLGKSESFKIICGQLPMDIVHCAVVLGNTMLL